MLANDIHAVIHIAVERSGQKRFDAKIVVNSGPSRATI
jgi:hypothetical protein